MKRDFRSRKHGVLMLSSGLAALVLRRTLYATAVDVKGLLLRGHPLELALGALSAAVFVWIVLAARKQEPAGSFEDCYSADIFGALGNVAAGAGILYTVMTGELQTVGYLNTVWRVLGLTAPVCLLLAGFARVWGKRPFFLLHVVACLFFVVHIVTHYQFWSSNPQIQDYVFSLLGAMTLMLFGFYTASMEADCGSRPMTMGVGLAALYLCTAELARSACPGLYLGGVLWVLSDFFSVCKMEKEET